MCPEHRTPLRYHRPGNVHACQDPDCRYAQGLEPVAFEEFIELRLASFQRRRRHVAELVLREFL